MFRVIYPIRSVVNISFSLSSFSSSSPILLSSISSSSSRLCYRLKQNPSALFSFQKPRSFGTKQQSNHSSSTSTSTSQAKIPRYKPSIHTADDYVLPHPVWLKEDLDKVPIAHREPENNVDKLAFYIAKVIRFNFDWMTGFSWTKKNELTWLNRIIFLESIAGVPGWVAATIRHLNSLRKMTRYHGWIHTLLEEAENERMHLMTALQLRDPGVVFRLMVFISQGIFFNFFFLAYLISPRFCHRLVGYFEEEAVYTYTKLLIAIDHGDLPKWKDAPAPPIAKKYWEMSDDAKIRDVWAAIRADESHHRDVNHEFASLKSNQPNPFKPGH